MKYDLTAYTENGYDEEQLTAICNAFEQNIPIEPYLDTAYRGACITEIATGLAHHINVTPYADSRYTWRKMREIRLGIEHHLDISQYADPLYSYWQMKEIRLGLKDGLDIDYYKNIMYTAKEMQKRRKLLKNKKKTSNMQENWTVFSNVDYEIRVSPDGLHAYFDWHCMRPVNNVQELQFILNKHGIVYGIEYGTLDTIAKTYETIHAGTKRNQNTLIAKGTAPVHGENGYYEWLFDTRTNRLPKPLDDGTADFYNLQWFVPVAKKQPVALYHFATAGIDGKTVTGMSIPAKAGKEKSMLKGSGFELLPDLKTYAASKDGHVQLHKNKLVVTDLLVMDELSPSRTPLYFNSSVSIKGNITGPVTIHVNGDLQVDGFVKDAQIKCNGNILIKSGINAASKASRITLKGYIISKFFEYVTLHADGNIYFGSSLNSNLSSCGEIIGYGKKGGIIGGSCYSEKGYCLPNLGNAAGTNTTLLLGDNDIIRSRRFALENEITEIESTIERLTKACQTLRENSAEQTWKTNDLYQKAEKALRIKTKQLNTAHKSIAQLEERLVRAHQSRIVVEQHLYDNVQIHYMDKKITAIPSTQVAILIKNEELIVEKLSLCDTQSA